MSVGLDIGSKTVKIVELVKEKDTFKLRASGVIGYAGIGVDSLKTDKDAVPLSDSIRKLWKEAKIDSKEVRVALPESLVFTRTVKFPYLTDNEVESAIKWEAEQYIPIPVNEAIVRHQIIQRNENATPPEVIVLLVASPRDLVEKYQKVIHAAGLTLIALETELMSLVRSLAPSEGTAMIVDFGARSTDIAISRNGQISFSRSISTSGDAITRAVAQGLGIEKTRAEEYKKTYGLSEKLLEGKVKAVIEPVFRLIIEEIKKSIQFYKSEEKGETPTSIILSGGSSGMPEAVSYLTRATGLEVDIGNPFARVSVDPEAAKILAGFAPLYSVAVGLAERTD